MNRKKIGEIGVDSGQIMICDPCYLAEWKDTEFPLPGIPEDVRTHAFNYDGACKETLLSEESAGQLGDCLAVVANSGYGDGCYPVYVEYNEEGRVMRITIDFN